MSELAVVSVRHSAVEPSPYDEDVILCGKPEL
jgi:hypothetical protein